MLTADADGDGRFETLMGDTISPADGRPVRFRVEVRGGMDRRLWLIADGVPIDIRPLDKVESTHDFTLDVSGRRYVRRGAAGEPRAPGARRGGVGDDEPDLGDEQSLS